MYKLSWADIGSAHSLFQYVPKTSTPSTPHRQLSDTYGLLIPEANSYCNSNPFSPTLRIYLLKANTFLIYEKEVSDFELKAEFRISESGKYVRAKLLENN